jgi:hypothetical protein
MPEAADDDLQPERPSAKPFVPRGVDQIVIGEQQERVNEVVRRAPAVLGDSVSTLCRVCAVGLL